MGRTRVWSLIMALVLLASSTVHADVGDAVRPVRTDWEVTVNGQYCNLTGVLKRGSSLYVPGWQFARCVPGLLYNWNDRAQEAIFEYLMYPGFPGKQHTLQMRAYPTSSSLIYLTRYDAYHTGPVYPDGAPEVNGDHWTGGEVYDLTYHDQSPFQYQDTNYFALRNLANTFDWEVRVDATEGILAIDTHHTYILTDYERNKLTSYSWATLGDHWWGNGTPATVRAMRQYTEESPALLAKIRAQGLTAVADPSHFRVRQYAPGRSKRVAVDYYFTGQRHYAVLWQYGKDNIDNFVANLKAEAFGIGGTSTAIGLTGTATSNILKWLAIGGTEALGAASGAILLVTGFVAIDYSVDIAAAERCSGPGQQLPPGPPNHRHHPVEQRLRA